MNLKLASLLGGAAVAVGIAPQVGASLPLVIDDFAGGPHSVSLLSFAPPEISTGSFAHAGAQGGIRDVFVISATVGNFNAGVAFGTGGYGSFSGTGQGGVIWDGVGGSVDKNSDGFITIADDFDFGLNLDLVQNCPQPIFHLNAFSDLPGASAGIVVANSATEWAFYQVPLTTVGAFDDYYVDVLTPTLATGGYDPTAAAAIALIVDGTSFPDLDVRVSLLEVTCVPEPGTWMAMGGLAGLVGLTWTRARAARRK